MIAIFLDMCPNSILNYVDIKIGFKIYFFNVY